MELSGVGLNSSREERPDGDAGQTKHRMEPSKGNGLNNSSECLDGDSGQERLNQDLDKLWNVCNVLGIFYKKKLAEFGPQSEVTEERVNEVLRFLNVTRDANFRKLKEIAEKMVEAWELCNTSIARVESFSWILLIHEAEKSDQIVHWNLLSTDSVEKADKELYKLISERNVKFQKKYNMKKSKLKKLLADTHLTADDVQVDLNEAVPTERYRYKFQKNLIKDAIRELKEESGKRKELVVRMEMAKKAVCNKKLSSEYQHAMITCVANVAERMRKKEGQQIQYDGQSVECIVSALRKEVNEPITVEDEAQEDLPRTRSGRR